MTLSSEIREQVRKRAGFACEFCGVAETDIGGPLTVDISVREPMRAKTHLKTCFTVCVNCNQYKAAYWPIRPDDSVLWNPRGESREAHLLALPDGTLEPLTPIGTFTLRRLRLNRPALVAYRRRRVAQIEMDRLLSRYREIIDLLHQLQQQHSILLTEQRALLQEQQKLLRLLLNRGE